MKTPVFYTHLCSFAIFVQLTVASLLADEPKVKIEQTSSFQSTEKRAYVTEVDSSEKLIAVGTLNGRIRLHDADTSKLTVEFTPSPSIVIDLAFHPSKSRLASASYPKTVSLYDIDTKKELWKKLTPSNPTRIVFSPDGTMIMTAHASNGAIVHDSRSGDEISTIKLKQGDVGNIAFSHDGKRVYLTTFIRPGKPGNSKLIECETHSGKVLAILGEHSNGQVDRIRLSPTGDKLASLDRYGNVKLWDLASRKVLNEWQLDVEKSRGLAFFDARTLIVGGDGKILFVKQNKGEPVATINTAKGYNELDAMPRRSAIVSTVGTTTSVYKIDDPTKLPFVNIAQAPGKAVNPKPQMAPAAGQKKLLQIGKYDNVPNGNAYFDGLVSVVSLRELADAKLSLTMRSGASVTNAKLKSLMFDSRHHGVKFMQYETAAGQTRTAKPVDIFSLELNDEPHHFRYWRPERQLFLVNTRVEADAADKRLADFRKSVRPLIEHADQQAATTRSKKFLNEAVGLLVTAGEFHVEESQSALLFTDLPQPVAAEMGKKLDQLEDVLNQVFGMPEGRSIWYSKPIVAAFSSKSLLAAFEERVMNNPNHGGQPMVRRTTERYLQTVITDKFDESFGRELCWGYSLAYSQLLHSSHNYHSWINAGISRCVPDVVFPNRKHVQQRRSKAIDHLRRHRSLVGIVTATRLDDGVKPLACELVTFLRNVDPFAFSQLFRDMKLGIEPDRALQNSYGITTRELASRFGRSLRVNGVVP